MAVLQPARIFKRVKFQASVKAVQQWHGSDGAYLLRQKAPSVHAQADGWSC